MCDPKNTAFFTVVNVFPLTESFRRQSHDNDSGNQAAERRNDLPGAVQTPPVTGAERVEPGHSDKCGRSIATGCKSENNRNRSERFTHETSATVHIRRAEPAALFYTRLHGCNG